MPPPLSSFVVNRIKWLKSNGVGVTKISKILKLSKSTVSKYAKDVKERIIPSSAEIRIIGHILWDGSIYERTGMISYTNSSKDLVKEFIRDFNIVFGLKPSEIREKRCKSGIVSYEVRYYSKTIIKRLRRWHSSYTTRNGEGIPSIIFQVGKFKKLQFLRTFWEDEGSITVNNQIIGASRSLRAVMDIKKLMEEFKIRCKVYKYKGKKAVNLIVVKNKERFLGFQLIRKAFFKKGPLTGVSKKVRFIK